MANNDNSGSLGNKIASIWRKNPVLTMGLGLMPAAIATSSLKHALIMCMAVFIIMLPTYFIVSLLKLDKPFYIRIAVNALIAAVFAAPAIMVVSFLFPDVVHVNSDIYVYISVVIMDTLVIYRADEFAKESKISMAILDAIINFIGFALVLCIIAPIREIVGTGTVMGVSVYDSKYIISGVTNPFFGFISVGMLAAFVNFLNIRSERRRELNAALETVDAEEKKAIKQKRLKSKLNITDGKAPLEKNENVDKNTESELVSKSDQPKVESEIESKIEKSDNIEKKGDN